MPTLKGVRCPWIQMLYQHKAQCNSLSAAWMIFISGGMKIAWGIYEQPLIKSHNSTFGATHMTMCWFFGAMIGSKFAAIFVQRLSKNVAHYISGTLVFLGGISFLSFRNSCMAILVGRYMDGIAFGITLLQAIVTGGEVSVQNLRGTVLTTERIFLWIGICVQICYSTMFFDKTLHDNSSLTDDQVHGVISCLLGLLAIMCTAGFQIESPVFLHVNQRETESIQSLMRLQSGRPTKELIEIFEENTLWINDNTRLSFRDEIHCGCVAFIKLVFLRSLVALSISLPFHWAYVLANTASYQSNELLILYGVAGLVGSLLSAICMDHQGRRVTSAFSLCLSGTLILAVGGIFLEFDVSTELEAHMRVMLILMLLFQAVNAFGFAPATTIYISEAFALPLKVFFISGIIVVENLVQVIVCVLAFTVTINYALFFFTIGILNFVAFFVVIFWLPETKNLSLRECNRQFTTKGCEEK